MKIYRGSPAFRLFLADLKPIAVNWAKDVGKYALATLLAACASQEVRDAVANHLGMFAATILGSILTYVTATQFVKDNTKKG